MKRRLEFTELLFKILSYVFLTVLALCCLYPFVYAISASISVRDAVEEGLIVLLPKGDEVGNLQFLAFQKVFNDPAFWNSYTNTLFITFYGTLWAMLVAILGGYALSKKRLLFRKGFNFFLVFTMWFSAGLVPQYINYLNTQKVFNLFGITDEKWLIVIAMGMAAMNIILLRNAFEGVPAEIEEAAIVDGATELRTFWTIAMPMVKPAWLTLIIYSFQGLWNQGASIYIHSEQLKSFNYAIGQIMAGGIKRAGASAASTVIMMLVPIMVFVISQSNIIETMGSSGMKD